MPGAHRKDHGTYRRTAVVTTVANAPFIRTDADQRRHGGSGRFLRQTIARIGISIPSEQLDQHGRPAHKADHRPSSPTTGEISPVQTCGEVGKWPARPCEHRRRAAKRGSKSSGVGSRRTVAFHHRRTGECLSPKAPAECRAPQPGGAAQYPIDDESEAHGGSAAVIRADASNAAVGAFDQSLATLT